MIRLHTWWPGFDPMYFDNPSQAQALVIQNGYDYTPHFWVDGINVGGIGSEYGPGLEARKTFKSPARFDMRWVPDTEQLVVRLDLVNPLDPVGDYRIFVSIVEDDIHYLGANGYPVHDQTFKHMYPDTDGLSVSPDVGPSTFTIDCPLSIGNYYDEWVFENLLAVVYLQEMGSRRIWQAQSRSLSSLIGDLEIDLTGISVARWDTVTVALTVDPIALPVKGIEAEIEFDENALELLSITPGDWYTQSGENYFFWDYTPAPPAVATSAHFASSFLSGASADSGEVALLTFIALTEDPIPLSFSLSKVRDEANTELFFSSATLDSIRVTAAGSLRIEPRVTNAEKIDRFSVALRVEPIARPVTGVEADIEFDESVVRLDSIVPGDWYRSSGQDFFFYDYTPSPPDSAESIHFASAFLSGSSVQPGEVAVFHFSALRVGETALDFSLSKVRDFENTEMNFDVSLSDSIVVRSTGRLTIDPPLSEVEIIDSFALSLEIVPTSRQIKGVEANIDFDQSVVRLDSVVPGSWYRDSGNDFFFFDYTPAPPDSAESIHFASSFLTSSSSASGQVAVFHFSALRKGASALRFDLAKVRDPENTELHFDTSSADSILVRSTGSLLLSPTLTIVESVESFSVGLLIQPTSRDIKGVEAEIDFDESVVRLDSIVPGSWYGDSGNDFFFFDYTPAPPDSAESIHFASSFLTGSSSASGEVAVFHFSALGEGETALRFDLAKVRDPGNAELHFETSFGDSILVRSTGSLVIDPAVTTVEELDTFAIDLRINPRSRAVLGVEADIDFDEALVRLDSIVPGPWYTDSGEDYFFFDYTPSPPDSALSIHFASAFLNNASADSGLVATFHFVAKLSGETPLIWDLVKVRDGNNVELSFITSSQDSIIIDPRTTGIADADPAALGLLLLGNRPNPFNPSTEIHFNLPHEGLWSLSVYDVQGRLRRILFSEWRGAGLAKTIWDGRDDRGRPLGSGVYLTRLSGAGQNRTGKMILLK